MKAIANTTITLGLVNLPVQICSATESGNDVTFNMAGPGGERLKQVYVKEGTEEIVQKDDIQKGIFADDGFHAVSPEDLEAIKDQTKLPTIQIDDVIDVAEADAQADRITGKYFVQMQKKGGSPNSMKLFVDALQEEGMALVGKWTPRSRQELLVIRPQDGLLIAHSYAFAGDMRQADEAVRAHLSGAYSDQEMAMAKQLLTALAGSSTNALDMSVDEALPLKRKLVDDLIQGKTISIPQAEKQEANTSLADALAQSIAQTKAA